MINYLPLFLLLFIMGCGFPFPNSEGINSEEEYCSFQYVPFYERSTDLTRLEVECACQDSIVDLGTKLLPYTSVNWLDFECDEYHFNLIPPMPNVETLNSYVVTDNLPNAFPSLKSLNLRNTTTFYSGLETLTLDRFDLRYSSVNEIPAAITQLTNLTSLDIFGTISNELELPNDIGNITNLKYLELSYVHDLPNSVSQLPNLTSLKIQGSNVLHPNLPNDIGNLTMLERLYLYSVGSLPMSMAQLTNLKFLTIEVINTDNPIVIPPIFDDLDKLEIMNLTGKITPATQVSIFNAENLEKLGLFDFTMLALEPEIGQLTNLEELDISNTSITMLPSTIVNLTNLKSLKCWGLPMTNFPMEIIGLTNLEYLGFSGCKMTSVPPEIGNFTGLDRLSFSYNNLTSLPSEIANLKDNLKVLFLSGNNFSDAEKSKIRGWLPNTTIYF